jgi:hypothetical protein
LRKYLLQLVVGLLHYHDALAVQSSTCLK